MNKDMISIIVPVYNLETELHRCLDSILAQTYSNLEIIVVDDGSKDGSAEVMRRYAQLDGRIKLVFQENSGVTSARLHGVSMASGEWIGFVDGDDEIEPDMYERLLQNAQKYQAKISHCGYQMCFPDGRIHYFHNTGCLVKQDKPAGLKDLLAGSRIEPGLCNKLFHKTLFHSLLHDDVMDKSIKINEDLLMNYYLFRESDLSVFEDWCPYHYIVRRGSASRATLNLNKIYDPIRVKEIIRQTAPDDVTDDAQQAYMNTCINTYHALVEAGSEYVSIRREVRSMLAQEQKRFYLLGAKRKLMARMIVAMPAVYHPIYMVYCRYFQKNVYT